MEFFVIALLVVIGLGSADSDFFSPRTKYEFGMLDHAPPLCYGNPPNSNINYKNPKGKAATWSLDGEYICPTKIFLYGERDSYYAALAEHSREISNTVLLKLNQMRTADPSAAEDAMWKVEVDADEAYLRHYLTSVMQNLLIEQLGAGRVQRGGSSQKSYCLEVKAQRVQDSNFFIVATIKTPQGRIL